MKNSNKILIGIRGSQLSRAQTQIFINEANKIDKISNSHSFDIKIIKTSGDIFNTHRLDQLGGKGLFIKEIEEQLISKKVDLAVHSMKDIPSQETEANLKIICWLQRHSNLDTLISNSDKGFFDLPSGSVIGTSSIRRRSQILNLRKDLSIKLLRGNVDTRIKKLRNKEYDAIILSKAGLDRLNLSDLITEILEPSIFLPAANQGAIGIQARSDSSFNETFKSINHSNTEIECTAERLLLKTINANCNSPISVSAKIKFDQINISCILFEHNGNEIFKKEISGPKDDSIKLSTSIANEILADVGQEKIKQLDNLQDDFNYKAI